MKTFRSALLGFAVLAGGALAATGASATDNSSIGKPEFREHKATCGLVYRMTKYDERLQAAMKEVADEMNKILPNGIDTQFKDVSIVEIGFMGNVLREFYRISLEGGSAWDVASGKAVTLGK